MRNVLLKGFDNPVPGRVTMKFLDPAAPGFVGVPLAGPQHINGFSDGNLCAF